MKRFLYVTLSIAMIFGIRLYLHSKQEPSENDAQTKESNEPVATLTATKQLLTALENRLMLFQRKNSEQSERLAGVFANWKRAGKIKQAEQWNQVRSGIDELLSIIKIIHNDSERILKLRTNKELFTALRTLQAESQKITPKAGDTRFLMQLASLYGKRIFEDKLLEQLKEKTAVTPKKKKNESLSYGETDFSLDSNYDSELSSDFHFNDYNDSSYDDYDFESGFDDSFDFDDDDDFYF